MDYSDKPTVVIGHEESFFELLKLWIAVNHLPNVERQIETGISSDSELINL